MQRERERERKRERERERRGDIPLHRCICGARLVVPAMPATVAQPLSVQKVIECALEKPPPVITSHCNGMDWNNMAI